jgi:hypothetical protein
LPAESEEREAIRIPQMAPGPYSFCVATLGERLQFENGNARAGRCAHGGLAAGGVLRFVDPRLE